MKIYSHNNVQNHSSYTYVATYTFIQTFTLTKYKARMDFMIRSFLFNIIKKSLHDRVISLV